MSLPDGFGFVDVPGEQGNPVPLSTDLECAYCGTGLIYAGVGTKPKYCDEHKTAKSRKEPEAPKPVGRPSGKALRVTNAIESLEFVYKAAGIGVGYLDPSASAIVVDAAPSLAGSYRRMLETNEKFLKLFESADEKMAWLPIVIAHGQIVMAIMQRNSEAIATDSGMTTDNAFAYTTNSGRISDVPIV